MHRPKLAPGSMQSLAQTPVVQEASGSPGVGASATVVPNDTAALRGA